MQFPRQSRLQVFMSCCCDGVTLVLCDSSCWSFVLGVVTVVLDVVQTGQRGVVTELSTAALAITLTF